MYTGLDPNPLPGPSLPREHGAPAWEGLLRTPAPHQGIRSDLNPTHPGPGTSSCPGCSQCHPFCPTPSMASGVTYVHMEESRDLFIALGPVQADYVFMR